MPKSCFHLRLFCLAALFFIAVQSFPQQPSVDKGAAVENDPEPDDSAILFLPDDGPSFEDRVKNRLPERMRPTPKPAREEESQKESEEGTEDDVEDFNVKISDRDNSDESGEEDFNVDVSDDDHSGPPAGLLEECTDVGAFPFKVVEKWLCFDLGTRGPCERFDEWFVLVEIDGDVRGVCEKRSCEDEDEVPFEVDGERKCVKLNKAELCPRGMEMLVNPFGEGACDCREDFHSFVKNGQRICYQSHLQGPCETNLQLETTESTKDNPLGTHCVPTNCPSGQVRWSNDKCLDSVTCNDSSEDKVSLNKDSQTLTCDLGTRQLLILPEKCPDGQTLNSDGECKTVTRLDQPKRRRRRRLATGSQGLTSFLRQRFAGR